MHPSAMDLGARFFATYFGHGQTGTVLDIGAQDVNGSLRSAAPRGISYIGVDFVPGNGVDVVLDDPYTLPFETGHADAIVCSSVFEHSEFFWLLFLEMLRVLKPSGLIYLNAPSNGYVHRYPVDSWRFFPDAGLSLAAWGRRNGHPAVLLESFIAGKQAESVDSDFWSDFVAVFVKDEAHAQDHPRQIIETFTDFTNGWHWRAPGVERNPQTPSDDLVRIKAAQDQWRAEARLRAKSDQELGAAREGANSLARQLEQSEQSLRRAEEELRSTRMQVAHAVETIDALKASRSWRYTAWMRGLGTVLRNPHG